jgi:hypothetical protein
MEEELVVQIPPICRVPPLIKAFSAATTTRLLLSSTEINFIN